MATFVQGTGQIYNPSPSTPVPIHNVSGDNTIEICGKNLSIKNVKGYFSSKSTKIAVDGNSESFVFYATQGQTYTYSSLEAMDRSLIAQVDTLDIVNNTPITNVRSLSGNKTFTSAFTGYCLVYVNSSLNNNIKNSFQIEKGSTSSEYEAYQGNSQLISLGVENLFDYSQVPSTSQYDKGVKLNKTSYRTVNIPLPQALKPNTQYTISGVIDSNTVNNTTTLRYIPSITGAQVNMYLISSLSTGAFTNTFTTGADETDSNAKLYFYISSSASENTEIKINNLQIEKGSKANSYSPYGASYIELNKISTYQDYIYKDNDKWYLHKEIGKVVLDGSEEWGLANNVFYKSNNKGLQQTGIKTVKSNYFQEAYNQPSTSNVNTYNSDNSICGSSVGTNRFYIKCTSITSTENFKTWLSTHNTTLYYVLATPTNTEITDTTLLEQLNNLMTLPLYKNMTHITLTPNDLQPTMKIEYYRDTSINENFVPKEDMTKYYTKTETNAQIQISSSNIQQSVSELSSTVNGNTGAITSISNQVQALQSSTSLQIDVINQQLENGVEKVKTRTGFTFDENGLDITKGEGFHSQITDRTLEVNSNNKELIFLGYDNDLKKTVARMDWIESEHATIGVHRTETITRNGKKRTAGFYVGGGN